MKLTKGMTKQEVEEMVKVAGWEILQDEDCEEYGEKWTEMTILQDDHAVAIGLDDEGVYEIQFVPLWAL
jgi:hypothetical protein